MQLSAKLFICMVFSGLLVPSTLGLWGQSAGGDHARSFVAKGTPLRSCRAIRRGGKYYLSRDVICSKQGFALDASGIIFNLNGHTITYGSPTEVVPAISICDSWYSHLPKSACGNGGHGQPEVFNGKIVQSAHSHIFTPAIWIGQASGLRGGSFHDLTITIQEPGAQAFFGDYPGSGWSIYNNTIYDNVTNIQEPGQVPLSARSHFQGVAIYFNNDKAKGKGNIFEHNRIYGTPQGGILDATRNSRIVGNEIHLTSLYSNDYGVTVLADGQTVTGNEISGRGRGIDLEASRFTVKGNRITVYEDANNSEYGGCELGGSYGIRVKNYPGAAPSRQGSISENTVKVSASHCAAIGLEFSDLTAEAQFVVQDNTFITMPGAAGQVDAALGMDGSNRPKVQFVKNAFTGTHGMYCNWDGCAGTIQAGQTWNLSGATIDARDGNSFPGSQSEMGPFPDLLTISDSVGNPSVQCGPQSELMAHIGSYSQKCVPKKE